MEKYRAGGRSLELSLLDDSKAVQADCMPAWGGLCRVPMTAEQSQAAGLPVIQTLISSHDQLKTKVTTITWSVNFHSSCKNSHGGFKMQTFQLKYTSIGRILNEKKQPFDHLQFLNIMIEKKIYLEKQT